MTTSQENIAAQKASTRSNLVGTALMCAMALTLAACGATDTLSTVTCDDPRIAGTLACAVCGNGIVEEGETCDVSGISAQTCEYGQKDCTSCSESCQVVNLQGSYCGDAIVDAEFGESCDDGNSETEVCEYGDASCVVCAPGCVEVPGETAFCGDGVINGRETCDDGNTTTEACEYGEEGCSVCGNTCNIVPGATSYCGDGFLDNAYETCDDGNDDDFDACLVTCVPATCGDGVVRVGFETCDDGNDENSDECLSTCVPATCGDGFVQVGAEICDDANGANDDACLNTCVPAVCGDGYVQAGVELCDDANGDDTDGCLTSCQVATCGDGYVQAGVEACDDGNSDEFDGCSSSCFAGICGDAMVQSETEECDDGNDDDLDGCASSCMLDLVVNGSFEEPALQNHSWSTFDEILGWQRSFGPKIEIQNNVAGSPHHGEQFCELDSHASTGIYQDLETEPGQTYDFGFYFSARPGVQLSSNRMEILWDGEVIGTVEANGSGQSSTQWQLYQYEVTASGSTTRIEFRDVGQSDSLGSYLDAITVSRVFN